MSGLNRAQLQQAIDYLTGQQASFGEAAVLTALEVLEEQLAALPEELPIREAPAALPGEQRKQITILFAAIDGFTRLSGATRNTARLRQIDLLWRRLDETILNHGGVVDKHMGDVIMGIFGAPVSHEDDPERAVRCAMALRELVSEFLAEQDAPSEEDGPLLPSSIMRIGINTGQVSLGPVGSDFGQTVIGDAVNVASRLRETTQESGIYISRDTYRLIQNLFRVETLGEVSIKGRQTPIRVYRVVGSLPRLFFPTSEGVEGVHVPMVGREGETETLKQMLLQAVTEERGGLITILGDAGVGKSRLVREFYRHLADYPFKPMIFQARTDQRLTGVAFSLLRDLLMRHFGIAEGGPRRPYSGENREWSVGHAAALFSTGFDGAGPGNRPARRAGSSGDPSHRRGRSVQYCRGEGAGRGEYPRISGCRHSALAGQPDVPGRYSLGG